ncbi:MAG: flippase [Candidatus Woesearchaeota archaeon]
MTDYKSKAIKNTILILSMSLLAALFSYGFRIMLVRNLSIKFYGFFYSAMAVVSLLVLFRDLGLRHTLVKYISEHMAVGRSNLIKGLVVFASVVTGATSLILGFCLVVTAEFLSEHYFKVPETTFAIQLFALVLLFSFVDQIITYTFQGLQRMVAFSTMEPVRMLVLLAATAIFFHCRIGIYAPIAALIISLVFCVVIYGRILYKSIPQVVAAKATLNKSLAKRYMKFGVFTLISLTGVLLLTNTDTLMLTYFGSLDNVGIYHVAVPISSLLLFLAVAVGKVSLPMVSEMKTKKKSKYINQMVEIIHKYLLVLVLPMALSMIVFPEIIIKVFFGNAYTGAKFALQALAVGTIFYSIAIVNESVLLGLRRAEMDTQNVLFAAIINVILNFLLIPEYGIDGAAIATAISYFTLLMISTHRLNILLRIKPQWFDWSKVGLAGVMFTVVISLTKYLLNLHWFIEMTICGILGMLSYTAVLRLMQLISIQEIRNLLRIQ